MKKSCHLFSEKSQIRKQPLIFAHRGASSAEVENTMPAFIRAADEGADGLELDVQLSADGEIFVFHDENTERLTGKPALLSQLSSEEISEIQLLPPKGREGESYRIPMLDELLSFAVERQLLLNIELKNSVIRMSGLESALLRKVRRYDYEERVIFSSFSHRSMRRLKKMGTRAEIALLYSKDIYYPWLYADIMGAEGLHPSVAILRKSPRGQQLFRRGRPLRIWTVNTPDELELCLMADAESIITNRPGYMKSLLAHCPTVSC